VPSPTSLLRVSPVKVRIPARATSVVALVVVALLGYSYCGFAAHRRTAALAPVASHSSSADVLSSRNLRAVLAVADHFYWLNNGTAAGPLYARAEQLSLEEGDTRSALHAKVGRLRSNAETMSFVDLSRLLGEQLQSPIVKEDKELQLWCLIAKGYTDVEIDYRAAERDWLQAQRLAKDLGEKQWVNRASGELKSRKSSKAPRWSFAGHDVLRRCRRTNQVLGVVGPRL
jgi:hypothetical protein